MVKVSCSNWLFAGTLSEFEIVMPVCPRSGEQVSIHRSLIPREYLEGPYAVPASFCQGDDFVEFDVIEVQHRIDADGRHVVRVGLDIEE